MKILDAAGTSLALPYTRLVPAIAGAASQKAAQRIVAPERQAVQIAGTGLLLCMPAVGPDIGIVKLATAHPANPGRGLPLIHGEVIVFDRATGRRLALLDGPTLTARRTAAVTLLGIRRLAASPPASALLIGTGTQAACHADALAEYFGVSRFHVAGLRLEQAEAFCAALRARRPEVAADAVALESADWHALAPDIAVALTTSSTPVIPADLPDTTLAIGIGAFTPQMAEFPPALLHARPVVVDHLEGARLEAGDLLQACIDWSKVRELSECSDAAAFAAGPAPAFKTVGHAAWDLAAARVALEPGAGEAARVS